MLNLMFRKSAFLSNYMNNHPSTLLAYVIDFKGDEAREAKDCKMASISSESMVSGFWSHRAEC